MPPYRAHSHQRLSSLPLMSSENELVAMPAVSTPIRASCDACRKRKLRCTGAEPREGGSRSCERCYTRGQGCIFSARKPMGRPRTVSSTPPSPSPCLSQPTTPPSSMHPHYMPMVSMGGKLAPSSAPTHGFDIIHRQMEHMDATGVWMPTHDQGNFWVQPQLMGTPSSVHTSLPMDPHAFSHGAMIMGASASSDGLVPLGGEWSDVGCDDGHHGVRGDDHHRGGSVGGTEFMFDNSAATHDSRGRPSSSHKSVNDENAFPHPTRCLCESGNGIDDLRAQFRDITSGAPVIEIALGATHCVSNRLMASTTCAQCLGDQTTTTAVTATLSLVTSIFQRAVPALQGMCAGDSNLLMGTYGGSNGASPAKFALSAMEAEVDSLLRAVNALISQLRNTLPAVNSSSGTDTFSFDNMVFDHFQKTLAELGRRVSSFKLPPAATTPVPALRWDTGRHSAPPQWESPNHRSPGMAL